MGNQSSVDHTIAHRVGDNPERGEILNKMRFTFQIPDFSDRVVEQNTAKIDR